MLSKQCNLDLLRELRRFEKSFKLDLSKALATKQRLISLLIVSPGPVTEEEWLRVSRSIEEMPPAELDDLADHLEQAGEGLSH